MKNTYVSNTENSFIFGLLQEHTTELISVWNRDASLVFATPVHTRYFGDPLPSQLDQFVEFIHINEREQIRNKVQESFIEKKSINLVYQITGCNKKNYIFESIFRPILNKNGQLDYFLLVTRDVTELQQNEEKIRENHQMYKSLFDYHPDALFSLDINGYFTSGNTVCQTITGYSIAEWNTMHFTSLIHRKDRRKLIYQLSILKQGVPITLEIETLNKCKEPKYVEITIVPIFQNNKITGFCGIAKDITQSKQVQEKIYQMAYHDSLTGLPNRAYVERKIIEEINNERPFSLLLIDIDRLKVINDNLGVYYGDCLLKEFSNSLIRYVGSQNIFSRLSGDEFLLLLKDTTNKEDICYFIERLFQMLEPPINIQDQHEITFTISIGISRFKKDGNTFEELLKKASIAMNQSKTQKGNSFLIYSRGLESTSFRKFHLEKDLTKALEKNQLEIYYQPLVQIQSKEMIGFEALLRWNHPIRGQVPPLDFIPIAEETGLIKPISQWVLKESCRELKRLMDDINKPLLMSVNISAPQFYEQNFVDMVKAILHEENLMGSNIKLEITESILMENTDVTIKVLRELQNLGIEVYIDDFGTGYSSLSYLRRFPISGIKIDKSFTDNSLRNDEDKAIVEAIINLAHALNLSVIAEGVETKEQLNFLESYNCNLFQGYLFSRPKQMEHFRNMFN